MYDLVIQTTPNKHNISKQMNEQWDRFFEGKRIVFDDDDCIKFLKENYDESYVNKFKYFKQGAHKADLFRYAWLYKHGGIYCDIKTVCIKPLKDMFPNSNICYFVDTPGKHRIYNGIIATPPNNPIIHEMLIGAMNHQNSDDYIGICRDGYSVLQSLLNTNLKYGYIQSKYTNVPDAYIYREILNYDCNGKYDRYGYCNYIVDEYNNPVIYVRDITYQNTTVGQRINSLKNNQVHHFSSFRNKLINPFTKVIQKS